MNARQLPARPSAVVGAIGLIVLLGAVQFVATYGAIRPWTWQREMVITLAWWVVWIPLVLPVRSMTQRFAFTPGHGATSVVAHGIAAVLLSLVHLAAVTTMEWALAGPSVAAVSWGESLARFLGLPFLVFDVACYAWIAAALLSAAYARALRDEELEVLRLRERTLALEASATRARMDALQMELGPHFLFNALNTISGLVGANRPDAAREMVGRLGGLLRRTLRSRSPFSSIGTEMELVDDFLFVEKARFGDRLRVRTRVDSRATDVQVPTMLLQPLVENAVRHGFEPATNSVAVAVTVACAAGTLIVQVDDSGKGFAERDNAATDGGVGLSNTEARLRLVYGTAYALSCTNRPGGGARVELRLPMRVEHGVPAA